ncbi:MAG: ECF transporter S component [Thermoanaerobaculia bacterium]
MKRSRRGDLLSALTLALASALGLWAFLHPFFGLSGGALSPSGDRAAAHAQDAPLVLLGLVGLCLLVVIANLETRRMDARVVAVLGVLVGINASLRLVSGPLGASATFFLPILCGYVFGADFGFLLASLSVLAAALLTGGVGPWLPFQMFATGWCGMISGWLPRLDGRLGIACAMLAVWGGLVGFLFGAIINLWFWPYLVPTNTAHHWQAGIGLTETLVRYAVFYLATSSWWDAGRAVGNVILLLALGPPVLRLLRRFQRRFQFRMAEEGVRRVE